MVNAYSGKDCTVMIYIDGTTEGIKPDGVTYTWADDSTAVAIATSYSVNTNKTITPHHGLGHQTPQVITKGTMTYEFSLDTVYTTDSVEAKDLQELVDGNTDFAVKLTANGSDGSSDMDLELEYCTCSSGQLEVGDDGDLTFSISGQGTTKTITVA